MVTGIDTRPERRAVIIADLVRYRFSQGLLLLLAFCYVLQVFSPLRLNNDAIVLLSIGSPSLRVAAFSKADRRFTHRATRHCWLF